MQLLESNLLTILILIPFIGALGIIAHSMFVPNASGRQYRTLALVVTVITFAVSLVLLTGGSENPGGYRFEQNVSWIAAIGARYHLGVDGISLWLVLLTTLIMPIAVLSSWDIEKRPASYFVFLLLLEAAMIGVFVALLTAFRLRLA